MLKYLVITLVITITSHLYAGLTWEQDKLVLTAAHESNAQDFAFGYKNETGQIITIIDVKSSCGCTVATFKEQKIRPGDSGVLSGSIKSSLARGFRSANIIVNAQLPDSQLIQDKLNISVFFPTAMKLTPAVVIWSQNEIPASKKIRIELVENGMGPVVVEDSENSEIQYSIEELIPGRVYELTILPLSTKVKFTSKLKLSSTLGSESKKVYAYVHISIK